MTALIGTVAPLYAAFADVPHPGRVDGCTNCCISEEELAVLSSRNREELSAADLRSYAGNAPDTVGAPGDFQYFLPRLLEVSATGELNWPDRGWVVRRLRFVPWRDWPDPQRNAVRAYLRAWWLQALTSTPPTDDPWEVLASLTEVEPEAAWDDYLTLWLASGRSARCWLARFVNEHLTGLMLNRAWNSFARRDSGPVLQSWLRSGPPGRALMEEYEHDPDAPEAQAFLAAAALLETP